MKSEEWSLVLLYWKYQGKIDTFGNTVKGLAYDDDDVSYTKLLATDGNQVYTIWMPYGLIENTNSYFWYPISEMVDD